MRVVKNINACRLLLLFLCFTHALAAADNRKPGTIKMAATLRRVAAEVNLMGSTFPMNQDRVAMMRTTMAANTNLAASPEAQFHFGAELLNAGENEEALAVFGRLESLSRRAGGWNAEDEINVGLNKALCHLRMAEQRNCLSNHNADSCLMPIRGGGVHIWPDGSRNAIGILTNLLQKYPDNLSARWMLNIAAMTVGDYPDKLPQRWLIPPWTFASDYDIKRFTDVAGSAGLAINQLSGGSVTEDFNNDGFLDVMITSLGFRDQMRFFINRGDGTFADRTDEAGLMGLTGGLNVVTADYNNDGFTDALVLRGGWMRESGRFPNSLLKNNGDGTFEDVTEAAGMLSFHPTQTARWFDFDGDGWLDLFIGNESTAGSRGHSCELYRNNRNGTFTEMAAASGVATRAYVKGVAGGDYNNDGRPDLYLSTKGRANVLFRNDGPNTNGAWKFTDVTVPAGVPLPMESFPTWFFDYDNDGWEDIFVAGYMITDVRDVVADYLGLPHNGSRSKLYRNKGDGTFADVTKEARLDRVLLAMGANYGDLDNDGWLDFYLGTGDPDFLTLVPNRMFRNADGKSFQDVTTSGGFGSLQKGHGVSFADLDNDGDQDVHEDMGGAVSADVYPNVLFVNPGHGNHWLKLQLVGVKANRSAIGARIKLTVNRPQGERVIHRTVSSGGSFGCNPLRQEIGLGDATGIKSVEIRWPGSGTVQTLNGLDLDTSYRIREDAKSAERLTLKTFSFRLPGPSDRHQHQHEHHPQQ